MTNQSNCKLVTAAFVRAWANKRGLQVGVRGRLSQELIDAFNKAHRAKHYVPAAV